MKTIVVNNYLSSKVKNRFSNLVISKEIIAKNKIKFTISEPENSQFKYFCSIYNIKIQ